jgi:hypothetical protein
MMADAHSSPASSHSTPTLTSFAANRPGDSSSAEYAVAVAVGPGPKEVDRLRDLAAALAAWEPTRRGTFVMVDDHETPRHLDRELTLPPTIRAVSLHHPRHGAKVKYRIGKGIVSAILLSLGYIQRETRAELVLKLDTDSLIIGPFVERLSAVFARDPNLAVVGAHTLTPSGESRVWSHHRERIMVIARPPLSWRHPLDSLAARRRDPAKFLMGLIDQAYAHGYDLGEHCMGGGYAVSRAFLDRAAAAGRFDDPAKWTVVDLPEDVVVALHARALGMTLGNHVAPGETFGIKYVGLPMPPEQLVAKGYAVTHAVKNDPNVSEEAIRAFFRARRPQ